MKEPGTETKFFKQPAEKSFRPNWLFEIEPYSRTQGESLSEIRDNLKLKKALRRAVERDLAPISLIENIRASIRAC